MFENQLKHRRPGNNVSPLPHSYETTHSARECFERVLGSKDFQACHKFEKGLCWYIECSPGRLSGGVEK